MVHRLGQEMSQPPTNGSDPWLTIAYLALLVVGVFSVWEALDWIAENPQDRWPPQLLAGSVMIGVALVSLLGPWIDRHLLKDSQFLSRFRDTRNRFVRQSSEGFAPPRKGSVPIVSGPQFKRLGGLLSLCLVAYWFTSLVSAGFQTAELSWLTHFCGILGAGFAGHVFGRKDR